MASAEGEGKWHLLGVDTFSGESYAIEGDFDDEAAALEAAQAELEELERTQPSASSGGQNGIQDRVYVVGPDGSRFLAVPPDPTAGG